MAFHNEYTKQEMGANLVITEDYFMYIGIFLHFWGVFERVLASVLWSNKGNENIQLAFPKAISESKDEWDFYKKTRGRTEKKVKLLSKIGQNEAEKLINSGPKKLRDVISHDAIYFEINMGAYQTRPGWIKSDYSQRETQRLKTDLQNNPNVSQKEIDTKVFKTYSENDIKEQVSKLIETIKILGVDSEVDNTYKYLRSNGYVS